MRAGYPGSNLLCMRGPLETITEFVDAFVAAWSAGDASGLGAFFTEDAVYHNGPIDPVAGRTAIVATLESFMDMGGTVSVDMVNVVVEGPLVMTERVDYFVLGGRSLAMPVLGVFELAEGRIAAWRDYFDLGSFSAQLAEEVGPATPLPPASGVN